MAALDDAALIREQFPSLEASDFFRDPIDVDFVESTVADSLTTTLENIDRSAEAAASTAETLGGVNVGNFQAALQTVAPAAVELQSARDQAIAALLAGEVPAEVAQSTARQRAEISALTGVGATSGFATQRTFRDLDLNALNAIQSGIGFATQAIGQEQSLALNLTPRAESIFGAQLGALQQATVPTANQVLSISAEAERSNQLAELDAAEQNLALDLNAFELAFGKEAADDLRRATRTNALLGLGGNVLGGLVAGGIGEGSILGALFGGGGGAAGLAPAGSVGVGLGGPAGATGVGLGGGAAGAGSAGLLSALGTVALPLSIASQGPQIDTLIDDAFFGGDQTEFEWIPGRGYVNVSEGQT